MKEEAMSQKQKAQVILVNKSMSDNSVQIVMPPFRPISMYEIEDNYDAIVSEIKSQIPDREMSNHIIGFVTAFKDSIDVKDIFPIAEYFMKHGTGQVDTTEMIRMFDLLGDFIDQASDQNRLMH